MPKNKGYKQPKKSSISPLSENFRGPLSPAQRRAKQRIEDQRMGRGAFAKRKAVRGPGSEKPKPKRPSLFDLPAMLEDAASR